MDQRRPRRRSPLPYLLLNIIVSALTTLLVLWLWSRGQSGRLPDTLNFISPDPGMEPAVASDPTATAPPPLPPIETPAIQVMNTFGMGDIENEVVIIKNVLAGQEIWLDGWELRDEDGNSYKFQSIVLNPGAQIQIFSKAGHDSVTSLYWSRPAPVWQSGETIEISDYEGNIRATFLIP